MQSGRMRIERRRYERCDRGAHPNPLGSPRDRGREDERPGPVPPGVDHRRYGGRAAARTPGARPGPRPRRGEDRVGVAAHRLGPARDDVPGAGQGPVRRDPPRHGQQAADGPLPGAQLGARPCAHVRAGVAVAARPSRVPDGPDHRRVGPLHRDGADLERPRLRRPRGRRGPGRGQLGVPGDRLLRAGLVLPAGPAELAGPADHLGGVLRVGDLRERAGVPRHPAGRRVPHPARR